MTIAACAVTGEGVVLGADSTSTLTLSADGSQRYMNNEQKLFEVGDGSSLGIVTWGLGSIGGTSHRTHIANLADRVASGQFNDVAAVAADFATALWPSYDRELRPQIDSHKAVVADPLSKPEDVEKAKASLSNLAVGFCLAGHQGASRDATAREINFTTDLTAAPTPTAPPAMQFWGSNLFIFRVLGMEMTVAKQLWASGKWGGTEAELETVFLKQRTQIIGPVPLRETLDAIHALLHMTIKVMKFTSVPPVCGGPIELATITTDRKFRWVRHKSLAAAIDHP